MALHPAHRETDQQSKGETARRDPNETERRVAERETSRHERGDRELEREQRSRIVHQTFSIENCLDAMRNAKPADDCSSRNGIWRPNNCTSAKAAARGVPGQSYARSMQS